MLNKNFKRCINVSYSEMDFDKSLKPFSLLNYLQDIASENAEQLGFGYSYITPKNLMWVLLKYRIEFFKYPVNLENLTLYTEPRGYNKLFAYRNFEMYSQNDLLMKASSVWSLVNFVDRTLASVEKVLDSSYMTKFSPCEDDLLFEKIPQLTCIDFEKEFEVRYNDIDVNGHANNGNYIVWALEPLSYEMKSSHKLKTVDIVFKKEIKYGEKLLSQVQVTDKTSVHRIKNSETGEDLCILKCEWVKEC